MVVLSNCSTRHHPWSCKYSCNLKPAARLGNVLLNLTPPWTLGQLFEKRVSRSHVEDIIKEFPISGFPGWHLFFSQVQHTSVLPPSQQWSAPVLHVLPFLPTSGSELDSGAGSPGTPLRASGSTAGWGRARPPYGDKHRGSHLDVKQKQWSGWLLGQVCLKAQCPHDLSLKF